MAIPTTTNLYGKLIPPQSRNEVTLRIDKKSGFSYPFSASPGRGYFSKATGVNLIKSQIRNLIRTQRGERFMLPEFGCSLRRFLMEPVDEFLFNEIKDDIRISISKYLKSININKLQVVENKTNGITVKLFCSIKDATLVNFDVEANF